MRGGFHWVLSWRFTKLDICEAWLRLKEFSMTEGQVIREEDKKCPDCRKKYQHILSRDKHCAELKCECGRTWTVYFKPEPKSR